MALVIDLKPHEKLLIGNTLVTNDKQRTRLSIEGTAPILREKDTLEECDATTPAKKLYYAIQSMYLADSSNAMDGLFDYFENLQVIHDIAPHVSDYLNDVSIEILHGAYYRGLKLVQDLINFENGDKEPTSQYDVKEKDDTPRLSQSDMEAQLLLQAADQLQSLYDNWDDQSATDIESAVNYNRKLWMVFFDGVNEMPSTQKPADGFDMTTNIINLYNYIYKKSADIIKNKDKSLLKPLIGINTESATALKRTR